MASAARRYVTLGIIALAVNSAFSASQLVLQMPEAGGGSACKPGDVIPMRLDSPESLGEIAGIELNVTSTSDAIQIRRIEFHGSLGASVITKTVALPGQVFRDERVRSMVGSPDDLHLGSGMQVALIELEILDDQPFSAPVQIEAKLATVGRKQAPTVIRYDGPHEKIPNGIRIRIENSPAPAVAPESPPGPGEAVAMGGGSSMTLGGLEGGAVATASAPATSSALTLEVQPSGGGDPVTALTARGRSSIPCGTDFPVGLLGVATTDRPARKPVPHTSTTGC
jgi:hypothetical protein